MARTKGPLNSLDARGGLGKKLIYKGNKGTSVVKFWRSPKNPQSSGQVDSRNLMSLAVLGWQSLDERFKPTWNVEKIKTGNIMSGYNYYCSSYVTSMRNGDTPGTLSPEFLKMHYGLFSNSGGWVWDYCRKIDITNGTGGTLSNFQIEVVLDSSNMSFDKAQDNGECIRFGSFDDQLELPYYIMEYNKAGQAARIMVNVAEIPVSNPFIYMFYGNQYATSSSNGGNTFEFFDDFPGAALDTDKWDNTAWAGTIVLSGGILQLTCEVGGNDYLFAKSSFGVGYQAIFRSQFIDRSTTPNRENDVGFRTNNAWTDDARITEPGSVGSEWGKEARNDGTETDSSMGITSDALWHTFRVSMISVALCRYQIDQLAIQTIATNCPDSSIPPYIRSAAPAAQTQRIYTDYVGVRKAVSNEPTNIVGDEETEHEQN